jgi:alkanesulfonate monooxygenase SsuD/methylene tetrahydromethanopterin reductase-like flavin-dependent oxidoreductase (luciferase family)
MGALALGMALAFGLGGREVAARMLEGAYQTGQQNREQVKQDLRQGREKAKEEAERVRSQVQQTPIEGDTLAARYQREQEVGAVSDEPVAFEPAPEMETGATPPRRRGA